MRSASQSACIKPVHPFPARMAPSIIWDALPAEKGSLRILDPMAGSGTTLACARLRGHQAIGCDTDPLARLISRAWCSDVEPEQVIKRARLVLERAQSLWSTMTKGNNYPRHADRETRRFIDYWFDRYAMRELKALAICIERVRSEVERMLLWCAFSRMIVTKVSGVSLAMDVPHSRPHRAYKRSPVTPFDAFHSAVQKVVNNCPFQGSSAEVPDVQVKEGDARELPLSDRSVDMVIASPPYLNAIDYLRGHRLSLVWMGYNVADLRNVRSENIGSEKRIAGKLDERIASCMSVIQDVERLDRRRVGMIERYVSDMAKVMAETSRVLTKEGRAIFVVGDSTVRGVFVENSAMLERIAGIVGLEVRKRSTRPIEKKARYLPPPINGQTGAIMNRMSEEVILEFRK